MKTYIPILYFGLLLGLSYQTIFSQVVRTRPTKETPTTTTGTRPPLVTAPANVKIDTKPEALSMVDLKNSGKPPVEILRYILPSTPTRSPESINSAVGALCSAGFNEVEIATALKEEGITASQATSSLKNACTFSKNRILSAIYAYYFQYAPAKHGIVRVIRENYSTSPDEIAQSLKDIAQLNTSDSIRDIIAILRASDLAQTPQEAGRLSAIIASSNRSSSLTITYFVNELPRLYGTSSFTLENYADAFTAFGLNPDAICHFAINTGLARNFGADHVIVAAKMLKHLGVSREGCAEMLRRRGRTATEILNALTTVYG